MLAVRRLESVCEISMGQAPDGGAYNDSGNGWPLIAGAGDFGELHPAPKKYTTIASRVSKVGDIVLGIRATIGEKVLSDGEYCLGRGVAGLRAKPDLNARYLWQWLSYIRPTLAAKGKGATFKQVNKQDIGELEIALPSLSEQRRIAAILDQADALRAKRREALSLLDELQRGIFIEMFGNPLSGNGKYAVASVESIASSEKYSIVDGPFGSSMKPEDYRDCGVPVVRIANITKDGQFNSKNLLYIEKSQFDKLRRSSIRARDVLVSRVGTIGNTCVFPEGVGDALLSTTGVCKITTDARKMLPEFLHQAILQPAFQEQIHKSASTSVQKYFNLSALKRWSVIVPPLTIQNSFVEQIRKVSAHQKLLKWSLENLDALFSSLQHRAFRGEL